MVIINRRDEAMKQGKNRRILLLAGCVLILIMLSLLTAACEPIAPLRIENQTDQTLSIYVRWLGDVYYVGDVEPGEEIRNDNPWR